MCIHWFFFLQSHTNCCFLCRVNSVIGIGVGAGAYILSRFAVSRHPFFPYSYCQSSRPTLCLACLQATQHDTLNIKGSNQAHTGHQAALQSAAYAAISQTMNNLSASLLFSSFYLFVHSQRTGAKRSTSVYNRAERSRNDRREGGSTGRWIMKREDSWLVVERGRCGHEE